VNLSALINIVMYKAYAEIKAEISRTYLGLLWWIVEPVLFMLTFYYLFSVMFDRGGAEFVIILITGLVIWKWFGSSVQTGSFSIYANRYLIQQICIPKIIFPLSVVMANTAKFCFVFILLLGLVNILGYAVSGLWLYLPILILLQFFLIISVTLFLSVFVSFFPDGKYLVDNCMMLLMFLSGVFFEISSLPDEYQNVLYLNPMAVLIESYRSIIVLEMAPDWGLLLEGLCMSILVLVTALFLHAKLNRVFPKVLR